jgi:glyoxylase-like metal-dependent hydrolase (beta-lactamase superfamily II)
MQVEPFTFNSFMTNCYLCYDQGEAVLVDASCDTEAECAQVKGVIDEYGLDVQHLLLTHAHVDHIFGCRFFEAQFGQRFQAHEAAGGAAVRTDDVPRRGRYGVVRRRDP